MRQQFLLILVSVFILSSASFGALNAYLTITDANDVPIVGDATDPDGNGGKIECISFSHSVIAPRSASTGKTTGQRQHDTVKLTKFIDRTTPLLLKALCQNETLKTFELHFYHDPQGNGIPDEYEGLYTITLTNAEIAGIRQEMLNNEYPENVQQKEREHITLVYDSIQWIHDATQTQFSDEWDYQGVDVPVSDLSGDGMVTLIDFAIMADEWLKETQCSD